MVGNLTRVSGNVEGGCGSHVLKGQPLPNRAVTCTDVYYIRLSAMYVTVNVSHVCVGALDAVASMSTQMSQLQDTPQESLQGECACRFHLRMSSRLSQ